MSGRKQTTDGKRRGGKITAPPAEEAWTEGDLNEAVTTQAKHTPRFGSAQAITLPSMRQLNEPTTIHCDLGEYWLRKFFNLLGASQSIEQILATPARETIRNGEPLLLTDRFQGYYFPERAVSKSRYLQAARRGHCPNEVKRERRFPPVGEARETSEAARLARQLTPLVRGVMEDYAVLRQLSPDEIACLTFDKLQGCCWDFSKLCSRLRKLKKLGLPPNSGSIWKHARFNVARLWNWQMKQENEKGFSFPSGEVLRKKQREQTLTVADLYAPNPPDTKWPASRITTVEGKQLLYQSRWKFVPLLCQWCCRPIWNRSNDNRNAIPAVTCSDKCAASYNRG